MKAAFPSMIPTSKGPALGWFLTVVFCSAMGVTAQGSDSAISPTLRANCIQTLRQAMRGGEKWVKIHAGEDLAQLKILDGVEPFFLRELSEHGTVPQYRIGLWRVMAQTVSSQREREQWVAHIRDAFVDQKGPDRGHAAEALGKLGYQPTAADDPALVKVASEPDPEMAVLATWVMANRGRTADIQRLAGFTSHTNAEVRGYAAYGLRFLPALPPETLHELTAALEREPTNSSERVYFVSCAFVHSAMTDRRKFRNELVSLLKTGKKDEKSEACAAFARSGVGSDISSLEPLLKDPELDVKVAAANAILRITDRAFPKRDKE